MWVSGAAVRVTLTDNLVAPLYWNAYWTWVCGCIKSSQSDGTLIRGAGVRGPETTYRTVMHTMANQAQIQTMWSQLSQQEKDAWYKDQEIEPGHLIDHRLKWD